MKQIIAADLRFFCKLLYKKLSIYICFFSKEEKIIKNTGNDVKILLAE